MVRLRIAVKLDLGEPRRVTQELERFGVEHGFAQDLSFRLQLCMDELLINIISYGYEGIAADPIITVNLQLDDSKIRILIRDNAGGGRGGSPAGLLHKLRTFFRFRKRPAYPCGLPQKQEATASSGSISRPSTGSWSIARLRPTPPISRSALLVSDLALVPMIPSPPDLWAGVAIRQVLDDVMAVNETLVARIVVNQRKPHTRLAARGGKLPGRRSASPGPECRSGGGGPGSAPAAGLTVADLPRARPAAAEIEAFTDKVVAIMNGDRGA